MMYDHQTSSLCMCGAEFRSMLFTPPTSKETYMSNHIVADYGNHIK